jgi:dihydrodipicolinate reductase
MTVEEMKSRMSADEFMKWIIYFTELARRQKRAENKAKGIIDFTDPESTNQAIAMFKDKKK